MEILNVLVLGQVCVYVPLCLGMVTIVFSHGKTPRVRDGTCLTDLKFNS